MSTDIAPPLSATEADTLAQCEATIERGMQTFLEVGTALATIRDSRLYRAEFSTFEDYCQARWNISRPRAYELMTAAEVVSAIADKIDVPPPANEGQARELTPLLDDPDELVSVYEEAAAEAGGTPTASEIRAARQRREQPAAPTADELPAEEADARGTQPLCSM